jgi:hypothetical protein
MRILSEQAAADLFGSSDLAAFFGQVDWQCPDPMPTYFLPKDSGAKVGLARVVSNILLERGPFVFWVTGTGIWPSSEHLDLFDRYRRSFDEYRSLRDAPVHLLEAGDGDVAVSLFCLGLFFVWDFEIAARDRSIAITVSHDEWMEIRRAKGHSEAAHELESHLVGLCRS